MLVPLLARAGRNLSHRVLMKGENDALFSGPRGERPVGLAASQAGVFVHHHRWDNPHNVGRRTALGESDHGCFLVVHVQAPEGLSTTTLLDYLLCKFMFQIDYVNSRVDTHNLRQ